MGDRAHALRDWSGNAFWLVCFDRFANGSLLTGGLFLLSALISLGVRCALLKTGSFPCLVAPPLIKLSIVLTVRWSMSCISFERVLIFVQFLPPVADVCQGFGSAW